MIDAMLMCSVSPFQGTVSSTTRCSCILARLRLIENQLTNIFAGISVHCRETYFRRFHDALSSHFNVYCMAGRRKFDDI